MIFFCPKRLGYFLWPESLGDFFCPPFFGHHARPLNKYLGTKILSKETNFGLLVRRSVGTYEN